MKSSDSRGAPKIYGWEAAIRGFGNNHHVFRPTYSQAHPCLELDKNLALLSTLVFEAVIPTSKGKVASYKQVLLYIELLPTAKGMSSISVQQAHHMPDKRPGSEDRNGDAI